MASSRGTQNGPDATDVTVLIHAIQELHGVRVSLTMSPAGELPDVRIQVVALATQERRGSAAAVQSVSRKRYYPSNDAVTLEGLLFRLLHELDMDCTSMWIQTAFDKSA